MRNCDIGRVRKVLNQLVINSIKQESIFENQSSIGGLEKQL
jgi:hypothetical protein